MGNNAESYDRLFALGTEMIRIHDWLRGELGRLKDEVDAHLDGQGERPRDLRAHCLSFCGAVREHHTGEDTGAFPLLARRFPELRPTIEKLEQDHVLVSGLLENLRQLIESIPSQPGKAEAGRIRTELDGLNAILESHFSFEERRIVDALNSLPSSVGSTESLLGIAAPRR
ncbi:hemerythrin domain-containing protein [Amycolatopsis pigmentata]|uniref:Hemerythrin domain-containing protein n=1 Tax=Amycolatopsis pigmentata TaxID=450801 RepID=A0ABW5FYV3_9PSEU